MMMTTFTMLLSLMLLLLVVMLLEVTSFDVTGSVALPPQLAKHPPYAPIKLSLNGDQATALTRADGTFAFYNLPVGVYRLDVLSPSLLFPQLVVEIKDVDGQQAISVFEVSYPGAKRVEVDTPITLQPQVQLQYFQPRPSFSLWGMIKGNPMMVMMAVSLGVMMLMPKMMAGMDPEEMKKIQKEMNAGGGGGIEGMLSMLSPKE